MMNGSFNYGNPISQILLEKRFNKLVEWVLQL